MTNTPIASPTPTLDLDGLSALLRFPFREREAQHRFLLGCALLIVGTVIPILPTIFVYGYLLRVMRASIRGEGWRLPPWEEWGDLFVEGLKSLAVTLAYLAPGWLVFMFGFAIYFMAGPFSIVLMRSAPRGASSAMLVSFLVGMAVLFISLSIGTFLSILGTLPLPVALARLAESGRIGDAFHLRAIWRAVRASFWAYVGAWVIIVGLAGIAYLLYTVLYFTWVLCFVAFLVLMPAMFYVLTIGAVVFGEYYRQAQPVRSASPSEASTPAGDPSI